MFTWLKNLFTTYKRPENTGVILGHDEKAYVVGVNSPIVWQQRTDGNWTPYTWSKVKQWCLKNGTYYDQLSCTTNALITSIETQEFFLTGKQVRYSRRWVAKMSGTNQGSLKGVGNYMDAPAEWVRKNGLVLESSYPTPDTWTVDEFYADIDPHKADELAKEGIIWLDKWSLTYEFLQVTDPNLDYHLKHAPITVVIPGHDICGIYSPYDYMQYRDSYEPWDKSSPVTGLQAALKAILTPKTIRARIFGFQGSPELWAGYPLDTMQRLDKVKADDRTWLDGYYLDEKPLILPIKKP